MSSSWPVWISPRINAYVPIWNFLVAMVMLWAIIYVAMGIPGIPLPGELQGGIA